MTTLLSLVIYSITSTKLVYVQVEVIMKLAEDEGKDAKTFLKQQPFARPGELFSPDIGPTSFFFMNNNQAFLYLHNE